VTVHRRQWALCAVWSGCFLVNLSLLVVNLLR
jgi:hypothetical protein